jgi:2-haloalkanoic acid dehalogenase type II
VSFAGVSAITFDGDGTLWDFRSSMRSALALAARSLNEAGLRHDDGPITADWLANVRDEVASWPEMDGAGMEVIRFVAFEEALERCVPVRRELAPSICERYFDDRFAVLRPYSDVVDAIDALHGRLPLAIVTNGNTHPERLGFGDHFGEVVIALECGFHKPDPAIYAHAASLLGVEPGECLHVGDDPVEDVDSARRAGMRSVWLNRGGRDQWPAALPRPEAEIRDLTTLPDLL